ncbi:MAG: hypothetical protein Q4G05_01605 [Clostridia bacterium]|nr:hypothetical protein [Clostridia bacterium]
MKLSRHITISEELHDKVMTYKKENHTSYSEEITNMIEEAISNRVKQEQLNEMNKDIIYILKKVNLIYELCKQVYSDLNIVNITDPKQSYSVNEFIRKVKISRLDD